MSRVIVNKKFGAAVAAMQNNGDDPLDYMLSYTMGAMDAKGVMEYSAEFEGRTMTITLTKPASKTAASIH